MGCDMMVALPKATADHSTIFALNFHHCPEIKRALLVKPRRSHALDERIHTPHLDLPQWKETFTTFGLQTENAWGYQHGVNEHGLAVGCSNWQSVLESHKPGLAGPDLVRLVLERTKKSRQAVDLLTDLIARYGQRRLAHSAGGQQSDHIFLIADGDEAFVVEATDRYWAMQEIGQVRAVSDVGIIRQDWNRLALGLSDRTIRSGLWPEDGSKLDFSASLAAVPAGRFSALRRWGRATLMLEEQNGHIDPVYMRHVLADHYEGTSFEVDPLSQTEGDPICLCRHKSGRDANQTLSSMHVELADRTAATRVIWYSFGPPCICIYYPLVMLTDAAVLTELSDFLTTHAGKLDRLSDQLLDAVGDDPDRWLSARENLGWMQGNLDDEVEGLVQEIGELQRRNRQEESLPLVKSMMNRHLEKIREIVHSYKPKTETAVGDLVLSK